MTRRSAPAFRACGYREDLDDRTAVYQVEHLPAEIHFNPITSSAKAGRRFGGREYAGPHLGTGDAVPRQTLHLLEGNDRVFGPLIIGSVGRPGLVGHGGQALFQPAYQSATRAGRERLVGSLVGHAGRLRQRLELTVEGPVEHAGGLTTGDREKGIEAVVSVTLHDAQA